MNQSTNQPAAKWRHQPLNLRSMSRIRQGATVSTDQCVNKTPTEWMTQHNNVTTTHSSNEFICQSAATQNAQRIGSIMPTMCRPIIAPSKQSANLRINESIDQKANKRAEGPTNGSIYQRLNRWGSRRINLRFVGDGRPHRSTTS